MTDVAIGSLPVARAPARRDIGLKGRYAAERRFRWYGIAAIAFGLFFLAVMLVTIVGKGYTSFMQTSVLLPITFDAKIIDPQNKRETDPSVLVKANYPLLARDAVAAKLGHFGRRQGADRNAKRFPFRWRAHPASRYCAGRPIRHRHHARRMGACQRQCRLRLQRADRSFRRRIQPQGFRQAGRLHRQAPCRWRDGRASSIPACSPMELRAAPRRRAWASRSSARST